MSPIEFTVNQLRIAAEYKAPEEVAQQSTVDICEQIRSEIIAVLAREGGCTRAQVAKIMGRKEISTRQYMQELARQGRIVMCPQAHNEPAIYRIKK